MDKRIFPLKNYLISGLIAILSFILVIFLSYRYRDIHYELENKTIINSVVSEVLIEELDNYIMENSTFVLYVASSNDQSIRGFERSFRKLIINNNITHQIIYLDDLKVSNNSQYNQLLNKYLSETTNNFELLLTPNIIIFKDRQITDILYKYPTNINVDDVKQFLIEHEVIE